LIGEEFKTARLHLLKNLEGNIAWKDPAQAEAQKQRRIKQRSQVADPQREPPASVLEQELEYETESEYDDGPDEESGFVLSM